MRTIAGPEQRLHAASLFVQRRTFQKIGSELGASITCSSAVPCRRGSHRARGTGHGIVSTAFAIGEDGWVSTEVYVRLDG